MKLHDQYLTMLDLIKDKHKYQIYGEHEYVYHLYSVMKISEKLFKTNNDQDYFFLLITCLGHDLIEDTEVTKEYLLSQGFDPNVVEAIVLVSKTKEVSYKEYLKQLSQDKLAWRVKVCDTYSNLTESIKDNNARRVRKYSSQLELLYKYKGE